LFPLARSFGELFPLSIVFALFSWLAVGFMFLAAPDRPDEILAWPVRRSADVRATFSLAIDVLFGSCLLSYPWTPIELAFDFCGLASEPFDAGGLPALPRLLLI
jgi:hypothetical protein